MQADMQNIKSRINDYEFHILVEHFGQQNMQLPNVNYSISLSILA